jgi:hypothetical protein
MYNKGFNVMHWSTYQFYVHGNKYGSMYGETWSPGEGILPRVLVDVSGYLEQYINNEINSDLLAEKLKVFKSKIEQKKKWR